MTTLDRVRHWLTRAFPVSPVTYGGGYPIVREPFPGAWQRNMEWRPETVAAFHAVYACITRIAQDIGKLRPKLVERSDDMIWREVENTAHSPVLTQPNHYQNHIQFKEWWATSKLYHGNTYVLLRYDGRGVVDAQYILDPTRVKPLVAPDGEVFYELSQDNLAGLPGQIGIPAIREDGRRNIVHDRINCLFHPLVGTSPIYASGLAAQMGLSIQNNSAAFFARGSNISGFISQEKTMTKEKAAEWADLWESQFSGANSGRVAFLGDNAKFVGLRMSAGEAQLIEQLRWSAETVCDCFHIPAWKVISGAERPAYASPELANQVYYSDCLQSHIESYELCQDEALGIRKPTTTGRLLGVELDLDGLLRMDQASMATSLVAVVRGGVMTPNEARRKMDLSPLVGGDTVYMQHQDYPIEQVFNRTDLDKPAPAPEAPTVEAVIAESPEDAMQQARSDIARRVRFRSRMIRMAA